LISIKFNQLDISYLESANDDDAVFAKWVDDEGERAFVNLKDSTDWILYRNENQIDLLKFVKYDGSDVIIRDLTCKLFLKLTDTHLLVNKSLHGDYGIAGLGYWAIAPSR
jgi:hypothetical protein